MESTSEGASVAIDGESLQGYTETSHGAHPFWAVDLSQTLMIATILFTPEDNSKGFTPIFI